MARQAIVTLVDDLDGSPADETVRFGIGGWQYEIDLSRMNAARLRQQLAPFIEHARPAGGSAGRLRRTAASRQRSRAIRAWAKDQGIELSERGRLPADITDRYRAAGPEPPSRLPAGFGPGAWWRRAETGLAASLILAECQRAPKISTRTRCVQPTPRAAFRCRA